MLHYQSDSSNPRQSQGGVPEFSRTPNVLSIPSHVSNLCDKPGIVNIDLKIKHQDKELPTSMVQPNLDSGQNPEIKIRELCRLKMMMSELKSCMIQVILRLVTTDESINHHNHLAIFHSPSDILEQCHQVLKRESIRTHLKAFG